MIKRFVVVLCLVVQIFLLSCVAMAAGVPKCDTPQYKVSYYAYDCFNMQDESGQRSGYGYEMMQDLSKYLQCTFAYVGYDKTAKENEAMLRCHTYNDRFENWAQSKGFSYTTTYYETPAELSNALINGDVDAIVNSYIGTPYSWYDNGTGRSILEARWPDAELVAEDSLDQCMQDVLSGKVDSALLMTYTAQQVRQSDTFNRLRANIVPSVTMQLQMGINSQDNYLFYGIWDKTLTDVTKELSAEIIQNNINTTEEERMNIKNQEAVVK